MVLGLSSTVLHCTACVDLEIRYKDGFTLVNDCVVIAQIVLQLAQSGEPDEEFYICPPVRFLLLLANHTVFIPRCF